MKNRFLALLLLGLATTGVRADNIDFNLHDDALRFIYTGNVGKSLSYEAGLLHSELVENVYNLGLHVSGDNWSNAGTFHISVGGRAYSTYVEMGRNVDDLDALALGLGTTIRFSPVHRVGIGGHIYHAPDITSWADSERFTEWGLRLDYQLIPQAFVYVGYRHMEVEFIELEEEVELDDEGHFGLKLLF